MNNQGEKSPEEILRIQKNNTEEAKLLAKDQARHEAYVAKERELEKEQNARAAKRAENQAKEEIKEKAKEKARKEDYLAREKKNAEEQDKRRLNKK
jgi:hypothetical protein